MTITSEIQIQASREKVFTGFTDFPSMEERIAGITKMEFLEKEGRAEVGMKWRETRVMFGKEATEVMWITALTANESYVVEAESHGMHYRSTYTFTEAEGGTNVSLEFSGEPQTFMARVMATLMFPFFKSATKQAFTKDLEDLKKILEA